MEKQTTTKQRQPQAAKQRRSISPYLRPADHSAHRPINLPNSFWLRIDRQAADAGMTRSGYVKSLIQFAWETAAEFQGVE